MWGKSSTQFQTTALDVLYLPPQVGPLFLVFIWEQCFCQQQTDTIVTLGKGIVKGYTGSPWDRHVRWNIDPHVWPNARGKPVLYVLS